MYKDYGPPDICGLFKAGGKDVADAADKEAAKGTGDMFRGRESSAGDDAKVAEKITEARDQGGG